ncbi:MAG: FHA domain-containing protein [Vicinamibacterales bacterium]
MTIGRRTENDVRLTGSDVSRDHAEIVSVNGDFLLRDRGSRYGTFVNDQQVTEHRLVSGDQLRFRRAAGTEVVFMTGTWPRPVSATRRRRERPAAAGGAARGAPGARLGPRARRGAGAGPRHHRSSDRARQAQQCTVG